MLPMNHPTRLHVWPTAAATTTTTANMNDNLGKPGSADVWATSHLDTNYCAISWATNESAGKYSS